MTTSEDGVTPEILMTRGRQRPGIQAIIEPGDVILKTFPEDESPSIIQRKLPDGRIIEMRMPRPGDCVTQPKSIDAAIIEENAKKTSAEALERSLKMIKDLKSEIH